MTGLQLPSSELAFFALTMAAVVAVVALSRLDTATLFALVAALLALAWCGAGGREGFVLPGPRPPYSVAAAPPTGPAPWAPPAPRGGPAPWVAPVRRAYPAGTPAYPGAIELDEYETAAGAGHRDATGEDWAAPEGNPFDSSRVAGDAAAGPCADDEANDDELDGDERMAGQGRARNDATRVEAGVFNRRKNMDKYLREECEIEEDRRWWGRHEL